MTRSRACPTRSPFYLRVLHFQFILRLLVIGLQRFLPSLRGFPVDSNRFVRERY